MRALVALSLLAASAQAAPVTFALEGKYADGTALRVAYTFDPAIARKQDNGSGKIYDQMFGDASVEVGGVKLQTKLAANQSFVYIQNDIGGSLDRYQAVLELPGSTSAKGAFDRIFIYAEANGILPNDDLIADVKGLDKFPAINAMFQLGGNPSNPIVPVRPAVEKLVTDDMIGYWPGDGEAKDHAGAHDGANSGGYTAAKLGDGFSFAGAELVSNCCRVGPDEYVSIPNGAGELDGFQQMTASAWVRQGAQEGGVILSKYDSTGNGLSYYFASDNALRFAVFQSVYPEVWVEAHGLAPLPRDTLTHVAAVWRGGQQIDLYVNGVKIPVERRSAGGGLDSLVMSQNATPLEIGRAHSASGGYTGPFGWFAGAIDDVRIYDRALSDAEAGALGAPKANQAPAIASIAAKTADEGTLVSIAASASDPDGDALSWAWSGPAGVTLSGASTSTVSFTAPQVGPGGADLTLTATVSDGHGGSATATAGVHVDDVPPPPSCAGATGPSFRWPPNHEGELVPAPIGGLAAGLAIAVKSVRQDEPLLGLGSGHFRPDAAISGAGEVSIRVERDGTGDGRVYHLGFTATDSRGRSCSGEVRVCIPHDQKRLACGDGGPLYDSRW